MKKCILMESKSVARDGGRESSEWQDQKTETGNEENFRGNRLIILTAVTVSWMYTSQT